MVALRWDQVGERYYETGIDRGVLYLANGSGVAWSGLTRVDEDFSGDGTEETYFDGVKSRDTTSTGDYSATLSAYTYPDEFLEFEGVLDLGNGLTVDDQAPKPFGLSYRTRIGNDIEGPEHAYRIHLLYNLLAVPDTREYATHSEEQSSLEFQWKLSSVPQSVENFRPTAHVMLDTRYLNVGLFRELERTLYGSPTSNPRLPDIQELVELVVSWDPRVVTPPETGSLARLAPGVGDLSPSVIEGVYYALPTNRFTPSEFEGVYLLAGRVTRPPITSVVAGGPSTVNTKTYVGGSPSTINETTIDGGAP